MGNVVKSLLGKTSKPKVDTSAKDATAAEQRRAKESRAALFETEGGVAGEELGEGGVTKRNTLLGN